MSSADFLIVGCGVLWHLILGRWLSSPWVVPDVTLASVVLAMARTPRQPLNASSRFAHSGQWGEPVHAMGPALVAGLLVMLLSVRKPLLMGTAYVGAGWLVRSLALRWDLTSPAMQRAAVAIAEACVLAVELFLTITVTPGLLFLSAARLVMTVACLPLFRWIVNPMMG